MRSASISSLTCMVPISAVKALPERPATMIAVSRTPSSRRHADAEQIDGEDLGAEAAQLIGALIGEDDADQERQQPDDGQRRHAGALHLRHHREGSEPRRLAKRPQHRGADQAEKAEQLARCGEEVEGLLADKRQHRLDRLEEAERRRRQALGQLALGHLIEQRGEGRRHVLDAGGDAAAGEAPARAQDEPGADRVEHLDAGEIDAHRRRSGDGIEAVQVAIELRGAGDEPLAARLHHERIIPARDLQPAAATLHGGPVYTLRPSWREPRNPRFRAASVPLE